MTQTQSRWPNRDAVLVALYRISNASTLVMASVEEIAVAANIAVGEASPALDYLKDHGLVAYRTMKPTVALTPEGVDRAEDLLYPPLASDGVAIVLSLDERQDVEKVVREIRLAIDSATNLDVELRASVEADVEAVEAQLRSPQPSRQVVRTILKHALVIGENVLAGVITVKLLGL